MMAVHPTVHCTAWRHGAAEVSGGLVERDVDEGRMVLELFASDYMRAHSEIAHGRTHWYISDR